MVQSLPTSSNPSNLFFFLKTQNTDISSIPFLLPAVTSISSATTSTSSSATTSNTHKPRFKTLNL
ncbi:hypothetical protein HanRHA438_Chr01g0001641 [Helianthus annuus]|nr:hypothetical protein HanRHA438_Chr01g0001641 [Helianthus annuus]